MVGHGRSVTSSWALRYCQAARPHHAPARRTRVMSSPTPVCTGAWGNTSLVPWGHVYRLPFDSGNPPFPETGRCGSSGPPPIGVEGQARWNPSHGGRARRTSCAEVGRGRPFRRVRRGGPLRRDVSRPDLLGFVLRLKDLVPHLGPAPRWLGTLDGRC